MESSFAYVFVRFFALFGIIILEEDWVPYPNYNIAAVYYYYLPTLLSFIVAVPINLVMIYRILRREAVINNFQKAILFQIVTIILMSSSDQGAKVFYSKFYSNETQKIYVDIAVFCVAWTFTLRDIELCAICAFSIYWKNIFIQFGETKSQLDNEFRHKKLEISAYVFLAFTFVYRSWGNGMYILEIFNQPLRETFWDYEKAIFGRTGTEIIPIVFPLGSFSIPLACFLSIATLKISTYSAQVLKGLIRLISKIFQCVFVFFVLANETWINIPAYFPSTEEKFQTPQFQRIGDIIDRINWVATSLYPMVHSALTWYSISGLLENQSKKNNKKEKKKQVHSITSRNSKLTLVE